MLFIEYPKCSTCIKAGQYLEALGFTLQRRHIVTDTPTPEELRKWIQMYGKGIKPFFNTSGLVYKKLNLKERIDSMSEEEAIELLSQNGMLIKRPLLVLDNRIIIGNKQKEYDTLK